MGASVAYHLAARGAATCSSSIAPMRPGGGSTSRATGGFRAQYATAINVRLSLLARPKLLRFCEEIGGECGYEPVGYLWLASNAHEMGFSPRRARCSMPRACPRHVECRPTTSRRINPAVDLDGIARRRRSVHGRLHPPARHSRGLPRPRRRGLGSGRRVGRRGASAWSATPAARINAVRTRTGTIPAGIVVNAAGAWAGDFACVVRRRRAGDAAPAPGRAHRAHEGAALVDADDDLHRRRLPPARARRPRAAAVADARRARASVRRTRSIRCGWSGRRARRTSGCRCCATCPSI